MTRRTRLNKKGKDDFNRWTILDSFDTYGVNRWGQGMFTINEKGHVALTTGTSDTADIDLKALVDEIQMRGFDLPVLIHFTDILKRRIKQLADAFNKAIEENSYAGNFRGVYPIKVNQHRHVLEDIINLGREYHLGLECGSKPELLIATATQEDPDAIIICNGFKDRDYIEIALHATKLGQRIYLVVEKLPELALILQVSRELNVQPLIGIRMKLASKGKGLWETSGGIASKFGLEATEIVEAIKLLRKRRMLDCLQLLHFHIGSQISDIQRIKGALREAVSFFVGVSRMGAPIQVLDVGGGLAIDYDGSHTNFASSANYGPTEYAADVISAISTACKESELPCPTIVTESGRALVAHHSVLVVEAISAAEHAITGELPRISRDSSEIVKRMRDTFQNFAGKNFLETYHDALEARDEAMTLFSLSHLSMEERAVVESFFWLTCRKILDYVSDMDYIPEDIYNLRRLLSTIYYCNFSLFQSLPDHWAIKQLFPIMPLSRLEEEPTKKGIIADITCDSDGVIDRFVDLRDVSDTLPLHDLRKGEQYPIGIFLVGAYQEILGDLHNLFGDTNVVHVSSGPTEYVIDKTVEGDSIVDVLSYTQYSRKEILARFRERVEKALQRDAITLDESAPFMRRVEAELDDYTYLLTRNYSTKKK